MQLCADALSRSMHFGRHRKRTFLLATVAALMGPSVMYAQTCVGLPGPEGGRIQLGGGYTSSRGVSQFGVYAGGVGSSLFGQASTTTVNYDLSRAYAVVYGASLGYRVPLGTDSTLELCPVVSGSAGGIVENSDAKSLLASTRGGSAGLSLGYRWNVGRSYAVIPSLRAGFVHSSLRRNDIQLTNSVTYGLLSASASVVMGNRFTAYPSVSIPFGIDGATRSWGLAFTLSLWQRKRAL